MKALKILMMFLVAVGVTVSAAAQSDKSLGEVARESKKTKRAVRVVTDEDLPSRAPAEMDVRPTSFVSDTTTGDKAVSKAVSYDAADKSSAKPAGDGALASYKQESKQRLAELQKDEANMVAVLKTQDERISAEEDPDHVRVLREARDNLANSLQKVRKQKSILEASEKQQSESDETTAQEPAASE